MEEEKAQSFLKLIRRSQRGRLKIYLGYCAGVGKTYRLLQEGHVLKNEGIDVVAGFVETHGRSAISELLEGLEVVPRIKRQYRGIQVEEMDLDAVLRRKPSVALVDELAHTNVPGSRNAKRYEDVQEILEAGIHVITTLNIQHLESLYNTVENLVRVKVRERLPDTVISEADQIVNVDLSTEDLQKRLTEGKIYPQERISTALENFFTSSNLERLRELALRELAAQIEVRRREPESDVPAAMPDQVLVCLSSRGPNSELLLRYGSRFAGRMNRNWYALYVQRESEEPTKIDLQTQNSLSNSLTLAKQLGAIVFTFKGADLVHTILRFAQEYRIGHIIIGRPSRLPFLKRLSRCRSLSEKLIEEAKGLNIVVVDTTQRQPVPTEGEPPPSVPVPRDRLRLQDFLHEGNAVVWKEAAFKEEVLRKLTDVAVGDGADGIYKRLLQQERESSTFFNEGVAFPHLRVEGDPPPRIALGIIPQGIVDLQTAKPVQLVFLIISSVDHPEIQAKLLALVSKMASHKRTVDLLLSAGTPKRVVGEIAAWEDSLR